MSRTFLLLAGVSAAIAVMCGAFGAHALRGRIDDQMLAVFATATQYQFYHALGLGLVGLTIAQFGESRLLVWSGWSMVLGTLLFSGSLYALALTGVRLLGAITPFGGVAFILAWLLFAVAAWRRFAA